MKKAQALSRESDSFEIKASTSWKPPTIPFWEAMRSLGLLLYLLSGGALASLGQVWLLLTNRLCEHNTYSAVYLIVLCTSLSSDTLHIQDTVSKLAELADVKKGNAPDVEVLKIPR